MVVRELAGGHRSEIGRLTTTTPPTHPQLPEKHSLREGAIAIPTSQLYKIKGFTWAVKVKKASPKWQENSLISSNQSNIHMPLVKRNLLKIPSYPLTKCPLKMG